MSEREEFEKWVEQNTDYDLRDYNETLDCYPHTPTQILYEMWQAQQKKIDALKALNPDVPCPAIHLCVVGYVCSLCGTSGTVPLTKAQEYRIKELEVEIKRLRK